MQIEKDKNKVEKMKSEVEQHLNENEEEILDVNNIAVFHRWNHKYPNVTWFNFPPFTSTGDINDAKYELPYDIAENPNKALRAWLKNYVSFKVGAIRIEKVKKIDPKDAAAFEMKRADIQNAANVYFMKLIERHWSFKTGIPKGHTVWITINGFIGVACKSDDEIEQRKKLDTDLSLKKKRREELSAHFGAPQDCFCKFAERMKQNIIDFENFLIQKK